MYFKINSGQGPAVIVEKIIDSIIAGQIARVDIHMESLFVNRHYICRIQHDDSIIRYCPPSEINKLIKVIE